MSDSSSRFFKVLNQSLGPFLGIFLTGLVVKCVFVLQSGAGELNPQRCSREFDLQGAPASLLSGEGGFQQGQGFTQTHGAGERAQHQAVDRSCSPPNITLTLTSSSIVNV